MQVLKAIMLFPTIERMAQTPQGRVMTPVLCQMRYVAYFPLFLLSLLPERLKSSLIKLVLGGIRCLDHTIIQPAIGLLSGDCAGRLSFFFQFCIFVIPKTNFCFLCSQCYVHGWSRNENGFR